MHVEWAEQDSNLRLLPCKGSALPTELSARTEGEGFEPPVLRRTPVFKTGALDRSANLPSVYPTVQTQCAQVEDQGPYASECAFQPQ